MHIFEENIKQLGIEIPDMPNALANYVPYKLSDSIVYVSGQAPVMNGKLIYKGKVGNDISIEDGIKDYRQVTNDDTLLKTAVSLGIYIGNYKKKV